MSIGSIPPIQTAIAGSSLAQARASEGERTQNLSSANQRQELYADKAERAAGIATTEEDQQADERDADGRRLWEESPRRRAATGEDAATAPTEAPPSRDASGLAGNQLDLSG